MIYKLMIKIINIIDQKTLMKLLINHWDHWEYSPDYSPNDD